MTDPTHEQLRRLFDRALELPATARRAFLDDQCRGDAGLKQRLQVMLAAAVDEHFLANPTGEVPGATPSSGAAAFVREGAGTRIGPYRLLQQIGEGGFGVVFMAEQEQPVARKVALKIIKLGMDTGQVVARFEQERQALAMMDHPNIARVLDAGATATGRPYFVMDLVKGAPIVEYCDKNNLTIAERLELFAQVCGAVQHAHGKGIIHRDLKPSNVLVGTQDGKPQAKVIDFGIAKATSQKLTEKTLFTEHQQVIGTLQYMSPEQAEGSLDIDTRTDVYSLGILLYELLTGSTPFDKKTLQDAMYGEIQRMIREVEPPRPSTRLSESQDALAGIAAHRRIEPRRLGLLLRGELDWIVMKALEKDRARRYETANGLAMDVHRYLAGDAIVAAPPSASYRLRKFVWRHRGRVAAAAVVGAALLVGAVAFAWEAAVARQQRDRAVLAEKGAVANELVAQQARTEAVNHASLAEAQATLALATIQQIIVQTSQLQVPGTSEFKKGMLDLALANVGSVAANYEKSTSKEATTAAIHNELGHLYLRLGKSELARPQFERVLAIAEERVKIKQGSDPSRKNLAAAHLALAEVGVAAGRDLQEVLVHNRAGLGLWQDIYDHPKDDGFQLDRPQVAEALAECNQRVGSVLYRLGEIAAAAPYFRRGLDLREQLAAEQPGDATRRGNLAYSCLALAEAHFRMGDNAAARACYQRCLALRQPQGTATADSKATGELAAAQYMLGQFALRTGDLAAAAAALEDSRALRQQVVDADPQMVDALRYLAQSHFLLAHVAERRGDAGLAAKHFTAAGTLREQVAKTDPSSERYQAERMVVLPHTGDVPAAAAIADRLAGKVGIDNELRIDLARCYAQCARAVPAAAAASNFRERAVQMLRAAVDSGYADRVSLATDPDLAAMQQDPGFTALLRDLPQPR
jgi:serine/threonine protein kinase/tetratricopeptide (TPR) repeat protein